MIHMNVSSWLQETWYLGYNNVENNPPSLPQSLVKTPHTVDQDVMHGMILQEFLKSGKRSKPPPTASMST